MRTIWKYDIPVTAAPGDPFDVDTIPGEIVHFGPDPHGRTCLWVIGDADSTQETVRRRFVVFGTGWLIPDGHNHVASWNAAPFMWHLFQEDKEG